MTNKEFHETYLLLGEGDFSFAVDLVRFLSQQRSKATVYATGIDSRDELRQKYKDSNFLLSKLVKEVHHGVTVTLHHGVNAIDGSDDQEPGIPKCHRVIFNHPHLGVEDAQLHSFFLSHLFHAVDQIWMAKDGFFYMALVKGQFDRWQCQQAAQKCSLQIVQRIKFESPLRDSAYFQHRRHQTGRSFSNRSEGSELIILTRANHVVDHGHFTYRLPWYQEFQGEQQIDKIGFSCTECGKAFLEERSLKNHTRSKHQKRKRTGYTCLQCPDHRVFESEEALLAHERAKHSASHTFVPAERGRLSHQIVHVATDEPKQKCDICGMPMDMFGDKADHLKVFDPVFISQTDSLPDSVTCSYCDRTFRDNRARLQHENFCSHRKMPTHPLV